MNFLGLLTQHSGVVTRNDSVTTDITNMPRQKPMFLGATGCQTASF